MCSAAAETWKTLTLKLSYIDFIEYQIVTNDYVQFSVLRIEMFQPSHTRTIHTKRKLEISVNIKKKMSEVLQIDEKIVWTDKGNRLIKTIFTQNDYFRNRIIVPAILEIHGYSIVDILLFNVRRRFKSKKPKFYSLCTIFK